LFFFSINCLANKSENHKSLYKPENHISLYCSHSKEDFIAYISMLNFDPPRTWNPTDDMTFISIKLNLYISQCNFCYCSQCKKNYPRSSDSTEPEVFICTSLNLFINRKIHDIFICISITGLKKKFH